MRVAVVGLGKLGLCLAEVYASKGHGVIGVDINEDLVDTLQRQECPYYEPGLEDMILDQDVVFTSSYELVFQTDIAFVIVPTPSKLMGTFDNKFVENALSRLRNYRGLVVVVSTVMPGSCRWFKEAYDLRILYNPEFIALGNVIHGMLSPDTVLIGQDSNSDGMLLENFIHTIIGNDVPVHRMSYENAELAKLMLNCYITTKISFVNQLAELCENLPNGNVSDIVRFLGSDSRIGPKYLQSGSGFGGPCFPRDNQAVLSFFRSELGKAVVDINDSIPNRILARVVQLAESDCKISVLGLTYKPDTTVIEESKSVALIRKLTPFYKVCAYDPSGVVIEGIECCYSLKECLQDSELAIIATPWNEFKYLDLKPMKHKCVFDCWRILTNKQDCEVYKAVGIA